METQIFGLSPRHLEECVITFLKSKENIRCPHGAWRFLVQIRAGSQLVPLIKSLNILVLSLFPYLCKEMGVFCLCPRSSNNITNSQSLSKSYAMPEC